MKIWTEAEITNMLKTNPKAQRKAILTLYGLQTLDEQLTRRTRHKNHVGFSAADGHKMSAVAIKILNRAPMRYAEYQDATSRLMKYAGQLTSIANQNEQQKAQTELKDF